VAREEAELVSLDWERIQVICRLRFPRPGPAPIESIRLQAENAPPMAPTHAETSDGIVAVRFNVMLGPGQQPLAEGRWTLATDAGPLCLTTAPELHAGTSERRFEFRGGWYRVDTTVDADRSLSFTVAFHDGNLAYLSPARRIARWWRQTIRHRVFDTLLGYHRRRARRTGRRILFTSDSHAGLAGNLADLHERMLERGLDREYQIETLFRPSVAKGRSWRDRWRLPRLLALADVILLDDFQPSVYHLPPDPAVRIVQLWHASGAFKTVGYSRIGKPGGPSPFARMHKNYTHAIVSGRHDVPFYAEAFGLPEERVVPTGIPRMDRFFDERMRAEGLARARRLFPMIEGRATILLAPTFRGPGPREASYAFDLLDLAALHALCVAKDAVVIVKMHPFVAERLHIPEALGDRILDGTDADIDVNDLLFAVDLLITDYSSIVFEFSTLLRPMLFFAYDLDEYVAERDFYVPFEEFVPGRIARTFGELLEAIRDGEYEAEKVPEFARRHFDHLDGSATDRVIDELILRR
jgi:CDP-ribitol ribitolphosphotransferase